MILSLNLAVDVVVSPPEFKYEMILIEKYISIREDFIQDQAQLQTTSFLEILSISFPAFSDPPYYCCDFWIH